MSVKKITTPRKIEIEAEAFDKTTKHFELNEFTHEKQKQIYDIQKEMEAGRTDPGAALRKQCAVLFDKDESEFKCFDIRVITQIIDFVTEEVKNPS